MANTAFDHASALTIPGSTTNNGLVRWGDTSGTSFGNITGITSDGSNITLLTRGEIRFSDADSTHFIALESPATVGTSYTMTLPAAVPSAADYLKVTSYSGGAGVLEWASVSADTNTTYLTSWVDSSTNAILRLTPSSGSADDLTIVAGTNITLTPSGDNLTIDAAAGGAALTGSTNNTITTVTGANAITGEANLTFDGTNLTLGTGNLIVGTAGKGIDFSAQTGTASPGTVVAEILDHYEEGTWTPQLADNDNSGTGESQSYGTQGGRYTRIGQQVFLTGSLQVISVGSLTTSHTAKIINLPFACGTTSLAPVYFCEVLSFAITAGTAVVGQVPSGAAYIQMEQFTSTAGISALTISNWTDGGQVVFACNYRVN